MSGNTLQAAADKASSLSIGNGRWRLVLTLEHSLLAGCCWSSSATALTFLEYTNAN